MLLPNPADFAVNPASSQVILMPIFFSELILLPTLGKGFLVFRSKQHAHNYVKDIERLLIIFLVLKPLLVAIPLIVLKTEEDPNP